MAGSVYLTHEQAIRKAHYRNIIVSIQEAQLRKKKFTFLHLKYKMVKSTKLRMTNKKRLLMSEFFKGVEEIKESEKFDSERNLRYFKNKLIELDFIREKGKGRKKYLTVTPLCMIYVSRYVIEERVKYFLDTVFNTKRSLNKSLFMLETFDNVIERSMASLLFSN